MADWGVASAWTATGIGTSAVTDGSASAQGTAITNGTDKKVFADFSVRFSSFTPGTTPWIEVHIVELSEDGSTYQDAGLATFRAAIPIESGAAAKALVTGDPILLPNGTFKWMFLNRAGASVTPAADSKYRTYSPG